MIKNKEWLSVTLHFCCPLCVKDNLRQQKCTGLRCVVTVINLCDLKPQIRDRGQEKTCLNQYSQVV